MLNKRTMLWVVVPLFTAAFVYGIVQLFALRFAAGDVYPPYSSLRSDPLGAKALYQSLESLPGIETRRLYEPLYKLESGRDRSLFILGTASYELKGVSDKEYREFDEFLRSGGRVVISLFPAAGKTYSTRRREAAEKEEEKAKQDKPTKGKSKIKKADKKDNDELGSSVVSLHDKWGFKLDYLPLERDEMDGSIPVQVTHAEDDDLPKSISWHTAVYFTDLENGWHTIYSRGKHPVIIERSFGKGSLVICADSYFASNEALRKEPHAGLIAWLVGSNHQVVFDETHLGVEDHPGIALLLRKYHLHGLMLGLIGLAGLFVWKNATSFVPPEDEEESGTEGAATVTGKDSASGFANLLRRNIPAPEILSVCVSEWKKTRMRQRLDLSAKEQQIEAILAEQKARPAGERNPAQGYQAIATLLKK